MPNQVELRLDAGMALGILVLAAILGCGLAAIVLEVVRG